jgi:hypothetical protein
VDIPLPRAGDDDLIPSKKDFNGFQLVLRVSTSHKLRVLRQRSRGQ